MWGVISNLGRGRDMRRWCDGQSAPSMAAAARASARPLPLPARICHHGGHEGDAVTAVDEPGFSTLSIHAGARPDPITGARVTPIYQTTAFVFDDVDQAASLF